MRGHKAAASSARHARCFRRPVRHLLIALCLASAAAPMSAHAADYDWSLTTKNNPIPATLHPGEKTTVAVVLKNVGAATWFSDGTSSDGHPVRLATVNPRDRVSAFAAASDPAWIDGRRVSMETPAVAPSTYGVFLVTLTAPMLGTYPQTFDEHFAPLAEDLAWMDSHDLVISVTVQPVADGVPPIPSTIPAAPQMPCTPLAPKTEGARRPVYQDALPPAAAAGYGPGVPLTPSNTSLGGPTAVAIDNQNDVVVADTGNNRVLRLDPAGGFPLSKWGSLGSGDGQFSSPSGVAVSPNGFTIYVADSGNNRIQYFGVSGFFGGKFGTGGSAPGQFSSPRGMAVIPTGTGSADYQLVVADSENDRIQIVTPAGASVAVIGTSGHDPGQLSGPTGVAYHGGYLYVADTGNNRIQKFTLTGELAGAWGGAGTANGCTSAPSGVAANALGVFVSDTGNNRIQRFARNGAFIEAWGSSGTAAGSMQAPAGIAIMKPGSSKPGTIWVAEKTGNRTQSFAPAAQAQPGIQCSSDPLACLPAPPQPPCDVSDPQSCGAPSPPCDVSDPASCLGQPPPPPCDVSDPASCMPPTEPPCDPSDPGSCLPPPPCDLNDPEASCLPTQPEAYRATI
ncbi:MAG: hypothetical protein LC750_03220 [Actinobacteria bacterium]|nr:hypothetical protein [Actinomycetota bacterium]